ncbi:MAG: hypothetical protein JXB10_10280 [Pirellulales bacterium]|nr:hypothetical protein [Pirellulales bacterium]
MTRRLAGQLRTVFRRALGNFRTPGPAVCFTGGLEGLSVRVSSAEVAAAYHLPPAVQPAETLWLPFEFLADCEGKTDEPVRLEAGGKGRVTAHWRDGSVPQAVRYERAEPKGKEDFPGVPAKLAENPPGLLAALHEASETTDPDAIRYALGHIQLCGRDGSIRATDGRQLLVQAGFTFPWKDDLLIPRTKLFGCRELVQDQPVQIGRSDDWLGLRVGPWTFHLRINRDGRFPETDRHIPKIAEVTTRCRFAPADTQFLAGALPKLPCNDEQNLPVTVDCNGSVIIRAKGEVGGRPTECVLSNSTYEGQPVRLNANRKYLARALGLGLRELQVVSPQTAFVCRDETRSFTWMPLDPESAIAPCKNALRSCSPLAAAEPTTPYPRTERKNPTVSESKPTPPAKANGQAGANGHARKMAARKADQQEVTNLIEQAEALRTVLRDMMLKTNELVKNLKHHRYKTKAIASTLASLRQLKTIGV